MSDQLNTLADAISTGSPRIRAFALQAAKEIAALQGVTPPPPVGWTCAAPGSTGKAVTTHPYSAGINLNVQSSGGTYEDHAFPDGSGDSMVLLGSGGRFVSGITVRRFQLRKVAVGNTVTWGKHGFYLDAYNVLLEDVDISVAPPAASCLSIRMGGTVIRRALLANAAIPIGIYDSDTGQSNGGTVLVENARGTFTADTGIWCDAQDDFKTTFDLKCTFRGVELTGPGAFLKATRVRNGSFTFDHCKLNGNALRSGDVPAGSLILNG